MECLVKQMAKKFIVSGLLLCGIFSLAACGRKEERQLGIDGYVYVAKEVAAQEMDDWTFDHPIPSEYQVSGDFLYYLLNENGKNVIYRTKLDIMPEIREEVLLSSDTLAGYTVDDGQNLYLCTVQGAKLRLRKQSPEGKQIFELSLDGKIPSSTQPAGCLAEDGAGNVYVLAEDVIYKVGEDGNLAGQYSTADYRTNPWASEYLLESGTGEIFYVNISNQRTVRKVPKDGIHLEEVEALAGRGDNPYLFPGMGRVLAVEAGGTLCGYSGGESGMKPLLWWGDSNLNGRRVSWAAELPEGRLLASVSTSDSRKNTLYLLTATPVAELPKQEIVVLASLFPSETLEEAVVEFNRLGGPYHVTLESYGADPWYTGNREENKGAYTRLDGSIASGTEKPDLLDLSYLDFYKYAEKGTLEDLSPYLEKGGMHREDFLDNVLEGYTVNEKLICIPQEFSFCPVIGRAAEVGVEAGWTAEKLMGMADARPGSAVVNGYDAVGMVSGFFGTYCLDRFIDWEKKECNFDSEEFRGLLQWVEGHTGDGAFFLPFGERVPQELFLRETRLSDFVGYMMEAAMFGEEILLVGYPSGDGRPAVGTVFVSDAVGILSGSSHKDGAWAFLEYYLSREGDESNITSFYTKKAMLQLQAEDAATPIYALDDSGNRILLEDGSYKIERSKGDFYVAGEAIPYDNVPQEQVDVMLEAIGKLDFAPRSVREETAIGILEEELSAYFDGSKPLDEVVKVIQSRVGTLVQE